MNTRPQNLYHHIFFLKCVVRKSVEFKKNWTKSATKVPTNSPVIITDIILFIIKFII